MANEENLIPAKPGDVRNPKGKPKGTLNWSTIVKTILEDEELFNSILEDKKKPKWVDKLNKKNGAYAIAVAMMTKAVSGDDKAAKWLRETGWGNKLEHGLDPDLFDETELTIKVIRRDDSGIKREAGPSEGTTE